ncbi:MAG: hypothetical protein DWQ01_21890 [Planctomycetota bacterium]|nr:MAG: hypothetical protein DWQ01_21890 [Planctomycetota bacterium]
MTTPSKSNPHPPEKTASAQKPETAKEQQEDIPTLVAVQEKLKGLQKELVLWRGLILFLASAGLIAGFSSAQQWRDFQTIQREQQELQQQMKGDHEEMKAVHAHASERLDALAGRGERMVRAFDGILVRRLVQDAATVLVEYSTSLSSVGFKIPLEAHISNLKDLKQAWNGQQDPTSEQRLLNVLLDVFDGIRSMEEVRRNQGLSEEGLKSAIAEAEDRWEALVPPVSEIQSEDPLTSEFLRRMPAYRENILGLLAIIRYKKIRKLEIFLTEARGHFEAAIKLDRRFARPHSNMAVVESMHFSEASEQEGDSFVDLAQASLNRGQAALEEALSYPQSDVAETIARNNLFSFYILEIEWLLQREKVEEAWQLCQSLSRIEAKLVGGRQKKHPVLWISQAEFQCLSLLVEAARAQDPKAVSNQRWQQAWEVIRTYVANALEDGYGGLPDAEAELLFEELPIFARFLRDCPWPDERKEEARRNLWSLVRGF